MKFLVPIIGLGVFFVFIIPVALYFAWAASHLWIWFLVPLGLPPLSILQIWGIGLTISMFRPKIDAEKTNTDNWLGALTAIIVGPPLTLAIGYAIRFWWM